MSYPMTPQDATNYLVENDIATKETTYDLEKDICYDLFYYHYGVSKNCLIPIDNSTNFVIKWSFLGCDEAKKEVDIYKKAVDKGVEYFFPKTEILCTIKDIVFVIQEKIDFSCYDLPDSYRDKYTHITQTASDYIVSKMEKSIHNVTGSKPELNPLWAKMALVLYGKARVKKLCNFIRENDINDLHFNNLGYKKNKPVILDFSGYHYETVTTTFSF
jgi:hypothetical protein